MKKYLVGFVLVTILAATAIWWFNRETTLVDLQKQYLFAKTDEEREKIIDRLEKYYLNLAIPDSIIRRVDTEVAVILDTTKINATAYANGVSTDTNVYKMEGQLQNLLQMAAIARACEDDQIFQELTGQAKTMAKTVDAGTQSDYWVKFVDEVSTFTKENAVFWLKAKKAERLCYKYHDKSEFWEDGEKYGSIGLQYLQQIKDHRLRLDILQRLQVILYNIRGFHDLSIAIAERLLKDATRTKYILRATGIAFHRADALYQSGQTKSALELFQQVINQAKEYETISSMAWYKTNGMLGLADAYWQLGQYQKALSVCEKLEQSELTSKEKIHLNGVRGVVHRNLSNYDIAESEYKKALVLAESMNDIFDKIIILNNLGVMYDELTEFDKAIQFYYQAKILLEQFFSKNYEYRINLIINIAKAQAKQSHFKSVDEFIREANSLISKLGNLPLRRSDLLSTIGKLSLEVGKNKDALTKFQEAESICEGNGLFRISLKTKLNIAESMIRLSRHAEARTKILETLSIAQQIDDVERGIDSIAMLARIEEREGHIEKAVAISNRLIYGIDSLSSQFVKTDLLVAYRQKIYDYLKNAIVYEISNQRIDSAFVKLDYAKAHHLKTRGINSQGHFEGNAIHFSFMNLDTLKSYLGEQSLVINYLVTQDTLYAFVLDRTSLQLLRKKIKMDELRVTVEAYKNSIDRTIAVLQDYNDKAISAHFNATTQLGHKLFHDLMGWPRLKSRLKGGELIYIIPDEFLYEVPFSTLVVDTSDTVTFLVQKAAVVNLPGASFLHFSEKTWGRLNLKSKRVLISADPKIQEMRDFIPFVKEQFPLAEELKTKNESFEENDIIAALDQSHQIYIFSGHSVANAIDPDLSFIEISIINSVTSASKTLQVSLADLKKLNWSAAELVLLVGCETAAGKLYRGTGISGLQQGFLSLGAQSVLASLWKIDASQAIPQVQDFFEAWARVLNPALALMEMQLKAIQKLNDHGYFKKPHPYFWGSYTLSMIEN
jgi:CHAT domain-containing protein